MRWSIWRQCMAYLFHRIHVVPHVAEIDVGILCKCPFHVTDLWKQTCWSETCIVRSLWTEALKLFCLKTQARGFEAKYPRMALVVLHVAVQIFSFQLLSFVASWWQMLAHHMCHPLLSFSQMISQIMRPTLEILQPVLLCFFFICVKFLQCFFYKHPARSRKSNSGQRRTFKSWEMLVCSIEMKWLLITMASDTENCRCCSIDSEDWISRYYT